MKKLLVIFLFSFLVGGELFAMKAVLVCRTSGIIHKSMDTISMDCGNTSSYQCEQNFKNALKRKYGTYDVYDAEKKVCNQIRGVWYPDTIKIRY